jgi:hypothetical protein
MSVQSMSLIPLRTRMTVSLPPKPAQQPIDKLTDTCKYRWTPDSLCKQCGNPMYTYTTRAQFRYLKCRECGQTSKETR